MPISVNLRRYDLILPLAWRLAQASLEICGGGDEGVEAEAGCDGVDHQVVDDPECAPEARIGASAERGETPISLSSESVINATSRWQ